MHLAAVNDQKDSISILMKAGANVNAAGKFNETTAGTNTRNATFKIVHSGLLHNSHQQYENVTIEVSHSSMFKNHSSCKSYYVQNRI